MISTLSIDDRAARRFNLVFLTALLTGLLGVALILAFFKVEGVLPPTPITGTGCIDVKFDYLRTRPIEDVTLLALGSSVTWRNLNVDALQVTRPDRQAVNAATCYLYVNQTAHWAGYLLPHAPRTKIVLTVVSPRDFQQCPAAADAFFDADEATDLLFEGASPWPIYATNLRLRGFFGQGLGALTDDFVRVELKQDAHGSAPLFVPLPFDFKISLDGRCMQQLGELERVVTERGARLVLVHFPTQPDWRAKHDPTGEKVAAFKQQVRATLQAPTTVVIDGAEHAVKPDQFADPMHLLWPATAAFSTFIAERLPAAD
jgi:hypothetical protein